MTINLKNIEHSYFTAWKAHNFEIIRSLLSDDITFIGALEEAQGADENDKISKIRVAFDPRPLFDTYKFIYAVIFMLFLGFATAAPTEYIYKLVKPQTDFFHHANGLWQQLEEQQKLLIKDRKEKEYKLAKARCDSDVVHTLLASMHFTKYSDEVKQSAVVASTDTSKLQEKIKEEIGEINKIATVNDILKSIANLRKIGIPVILDIELTTIRNAQGVETAIPKIIPYENAKDSDIPPEMIYEALGYNFDNALKVKIDEVKSSIKAGLAGYDDPSKYQVRELEALKKTNWQAYFTNSGINSDLIMRPDGYLPKVNDIIQTITVGNWKTYFKHLVIMKYGEWIVMRQMIDNNSLGDNIYPKYLFLRDILGNDLNRLCFRAYIESNKSRIEDVFKNLKIVYNKKIDSSNTELSDRGKELLHEKISSIYLSIAYNLNSPDYSKVKLDSNDPVGNVMAISQLQYQDILDKVNKPYNYKERLFDFKGAYSAYLPMKNAIILTMNDIPFPNFDSLSDAVIYGGIGFILGHEISHAFDTYSLEVNNNNQFDRLWMSVTDKYQISAKYTPLRAQYNSLYGSSINSLNEDVADNVGLEVAYQAYQLSLSGKSNPPSIMSNGTAITANQLFYYSFAENFRLDNEYENMYSTPMIRINGVLRNQPGFYEAFPEVKVANQFNKSTGKGMYLPEGQRVKIW